MLGESKRGAHHQSTVPPDDTRAAVWRSPTIPCSAMGGYRSIGRSPARPYGPVIESSLLTTHRAQMMKPDIAIITTDHTG
ncbi:hypothetical protein BX260_6706 [Streptomyces sp. 5112.2]|nr:hypothetical protein BX260_6706 [Streptomyces sp. 5112.2]